MKIHIDNDVNIIANFKYYKPPSQGGDGTTYYKLIYKSNGGTNYADEKYKKGTMVRLKKPHREGYRFDHWYEEDAPDVWHTSTITMVKNFTLVAEYVQISEI